MSDTPTLYEWAGGEQAVRKLFSTFYEEVVPGNAILEPVFRGMDSDHFGVVADFVCEVLGGPNLYTRQGKSHATMVARHIGKKLTEQQRFEWMTQLLRTADRLGLPDDPEFRSALVGYLEWGSRLAKINSHATDNPIDESAAMPTWGWGETGGPYQPDPSDD